MSKEVFTLDFYGKKIVVEKSPNRRMDPYLSASTTPLSYALSAELRKRS